MLRQQIYEVCTEFEEQCGELYLELSVRFSANPELSWFWVDMAMEEKQHAGMLYHCGITGMLSNQLPSSEQIMQLAGLFKRLRQKVRAPGLTVDDAFGIAIELESCELNDIYNNLTARIIGPAHVLRKKIELASSNHLEKLKTAATRFGVSASTVERLDVLAANQPV